MLQAFLFRKTYLKTQINNKIFLYFKTHIFKLFILKIRVILSTILSYNLSLKNKKTTGNCRWKRSIYSIRVK